MIGDHPPGTMKKIAGGSDGDLSMQRKELSFFGDIDLRANDTR
jgi:predicted aconitase with swiveling domain